MPVCLHGAPKGQEAPVGGRLHAARPHGVDPLWIESLSIFPFIFPLLPFPDSLAILLYSPRMGKGFMRGPPRRIPGGRRLDDQGLPSPRGLRDR